MAKHDDDSEETELIRVDRHSLRPQKSPPSDTTQPFQRAPDGVRQTWEDEEDPDDVPTSRLEKVPGPPPRADYSEDPTELAPSLLNSVVPDSELTPTSLVVKEEDLSGPAKGADNLGRRFAEDASVRSDPRSSGAHRRPASGEHGRGDSSGSGLQPPAHPSGAHQTPGAGSDEPNARHARRNGPGTENPAPEKPELPKAGPRPKAPNLDTNEQLKKLGMVRRKKSSANHVRPNSGFYSLPEANPSPDVTTVRQALDQRRGASIAGIVCGVGSAIALISFAVGQWMAPGAVIVWALAGAVPLVVLFTLLFSAPSHRHRPKLRDLRRAALPLIVGSILPVAVGMGWQVGEVRGQLRALAPNTPEMSRQVLADRSEAVAVSECVSIAPRHEYGDWRAALVDSLAGRPDVCKQCLGRAPEDVARDLSGTLADRWHRKLLEEPVEPARACAIAGTMSVLSRPAGEVDARLLSCILSASTASSQTCCGEALAQRAKGSATWLERIRDMEGYVPDETTAAGLMTLAFHQQGVNDSQLAFVRKAKFEGQDAQRLAALLACESIRDGASGLGKHFSASLRDNCGVDVSEIPTGRETWVRVCALAEEDLQAGKPPEEALCSATRTALIGDAIAAASRIINGAAVDRSRTSELTEAMFIDRSAGPSLGQIRRAVRRWKERDREQQRREAAEMRRSLQ